MKTPIAYFSKLAVVLSLALSPCVLRAAGASPGNPPAASTNLVPALPPLEIPQSVFVISSNPKLARNPFFPTAAPSLPPTALNIANALIFWPAAR